MYIYKKKKKDLHGSLLSGYGGEDILQKPNEKKEKKRKKKKKEKKERKKDEKNFNYYQHIAPSLFTS